MIQENTHLVLKGKEAGDMYVIQMHGEHVELTICEAPVQAFYVKDSSMEN